MLPAPACNRRLRSMYKKLKDVESVSKALQGSDVDLLDVREWFDGFIAENPQYASYLGSVLISSTAPTLSLAASACSGVRRNKLIRAEKTALRPFAVGAVRDAVGDDAEEEGSFVERLQNRRRLAEQEQQYALLRSVPPTSNILERFFSMTRVTFGHERNSLHPITLEQLLFLRQNPSYWDVRTVDGLHR
ncbi:hypothetical protein ON010_g18243 [Phytophthora cinnamomi]|nr:hypothetical protein ON010_g18243 [Phytophthora cinnamomi]